MGRAQSVLPESLRKAVAEFGARLAKGSADQATLDPVLAGLSALPPAVAGRAEREIASLARLHHRPDTRRFPFSLLPFESDLDTLRALEGLEHLFLFHRDGHLREAALEKIHDGLPSAFAFAAVASRLNDWVPEVREAASRCAHRVFPKTRADFVTAAAVELLDRRNHWRRWTNERGPLDAAFARRDVLDRLVSQIATEPHGRMCAVLRLALRGDSLDSHLLDLSRSAVQPPVRALALRCLIEGRARWPVGFRKEWIDKVYGKWRRAPVFDERPIVRPSSVEALIEEGGRDRSVLVRKAAAEGFVLHRATLVGLDATLEWLLQDRSAAVRECAEFIVKERAAGGQKP